MGQKEILTAELLAGHPVTGAYSSNDVIATDELNVENRNLPKAKLTGDEIFAATDNAEFLGLSYEEIEGSLDFFKKIISGEWDEKEFIILPPGAEFTQTTMLEILGYKTSGR